MPVAKKTPKKKSASKAKKPTPTLQAFKFTNRWTDETIIEVEAGSQKEALEKAIAGSADLRSANLYGANLRSADLHNANREKPLVLFDGRTLDQGQADPLAGLCADPEATSRARNAWGNHTWQDCPMHAAHGWRGLDDAPDDQRKLVACFIALFDAGHLPKPPVPVSPLAAEVQP